ncbi:hypothetical protein CYMTET_48909 [Cymbomonas tetramitiformis]|uniref:Uncharacterized protein n=1 Tax=Cymbomonas tetramitiformis TaxID=36881 RepID=A0AAE0BR85_9CHLO|nr:hypothetical protein CYMTET_48909 [Cymbomonas tetramitiformis]
MTFPWTCLACDTEFENPDELRDEVLPNKTSHTRHAQLHCGHRHHTPVLFGDYIEVCQHVADVLHLFLNLIKELLEESAMRYAFTQTLVDAATKYLQEKVGCYIKVETQSTRQDLDNEKRPKLIGRECKLMFEHYDAAILTLLDEDGEEYAPFTRCWEAPRNLWNAFCTRLDNDTAECKLAKARTIKNLAKEYCQAFAKALSDEKVPLYAHIAYEHFPEWVEHLGDVMDLSTEGLEHFHTLKKRDLRCCAT